MSSSPFYGAKTHTPFYCALILAKTVSGSGREFTNLGSNNQGNNLEVIGRYRR